MWVLKFKKRCLNTVVCNTSHGTDKKHRMWPVIGQEAWNQCKIGFLKWAIKYFLFLLIFLTLPSTSCINILWHLPNVLNFKLKFIKCVTCDLKSWYIHTTLLFISPFGSQLTLCELTQALSFYFLFSFNMYDYCIFQLLTWLPNAIIWELRRERGRDSTWMPVHKISGLIFSCYIFWRNDIFQLVLMTLL